MRKLILQLAVSLDGFIEGPNGEFDWCFTDQDYGMTTFYARIDSVFYGRKSYELMLSMPAPPENSGMPAFPPLKEYVFTNTLKDLKPEVTIINGDITTAVKQIKDQPGKDIWLFGGASLITTLMNLDLVDEIALAIHPVILGSGKPLFSDIANRKNLLLVDTKTYSSGLVFLTYTFTNK